MSNNPASLESVKIVVSINCEDLIDTDIDVMKEFGELSDGEVTYYTDVTVEKDVTHAYTYHELVQEVAKLKQAMEEKRHELLKRIGKE
jgi:hypothetical protein